MSPQNIFTAKENFEAEQIQKFQLNKTVTFKSGLQFTWISGRWGVPELDSLEGNSDYEHWGSIYFAATDGLRGRFTFPGPVTSINFDKFSTAPDQFIAFYDSQDNIIDTVSVPMSDPKNDCFSYTSPAGTFISYCEFFCTFNGRISMFLIDNIKWS